ncbi:hypothetical protein AB0Q95_05315 [Streptomyces sp. NPDC059900]|uniref:hypothetical protein n=1 Tax=Streptomyces sp. NPDC059900 TaxID=3155816 RepID=UPI00344ACE0B
MASSAAVTLSTARRSAAPYGLHSPSRTRGTAGAVAASSAGSSAQGLMMPEAKGKSLESIEQALHSPLGFRRALEKK